MADASASGRSETVAMLFTDVEGSTAAARALGARWSEALATHNEILGQAIRAQNGVIEDTAGDGLFATFATASEAVAAARDAQQALRAHAWPCGEIRVRMGVHLGALQRTPNGPVGLEIHRAARIAGAAHGRQVVVSATIRALASEQGAFEDLGEHRLKDFPQPERLFHLVVGDLTREAFAPLRTMPARPTNIPALESTLIGREAELAMVRGLLLAEAHLVTLTGGGGTGKTRLALASGVELLDAFPGGTWFVPLADVDDPDRLLEAVATRVGITDGTGGSLLEMLARELASAATLLILDNLEQLPAAAEILDSLLDAVPSARILATSQVPLQLSREFIVPLSPLSSESGVELFLEQAARRIGRGGLDGSLAAVAAICERLDGLPLAIELAAARSLALSPEELLGRLNESFAILTSRERDRPERHRSLRATVEWTVSLLAPQDDELFMLLSTFAGTFTLDDAEAMASQDVLDGVETLIDFSLVRRIATEGHTARFTIAQALREFGRERLIASGSFEAARTAHAQWVLGRAEDAWVAMVNDSPVFSAPLIGLGEDARTALDFWRDRDPSLHLQLIGAHVLTSDESVSSTSMLGELEQAITAAREPGPILTRAQLAAGGVAGDIGERDLAIRHLTAARAGALEYGPAIVAVFADSFMTYAKLVIDPAGARAVAERAVAESATAGGRTWAAITLAQVDVAEGRVEVEPLLRDRLIHETDVRRLAALRHLYADCALLREDGPAAVQRYADAVRELVGAGLDINPGDLQGLAMALAVAGRPADALEVDAIADAHLGPSGGNLSAAFWEDLRSRHLGSIRASLGPGGVAVIPTDLAVARERALALAQALLEADSAQQHDRSARTAGQQATITGT